jgi:hypothetical protein
VCVGRRSNTDERLSLNLFDRRLGQNKNLLKYYASDPQKDDLLTAFKKWCLRHCQQITVETFCDGLEVVPFISPKTTMSKFSNRLHCLIVFALHNEILSSCRVYLYSI